MKPVRTIPAVPVADDAPKAVERSVSSAGKGYDSLEQERIAKFVLEKHKKALAELAK